MKNKTGLATLSVRHVGPRAQRDTRNVDPQSLPHSSASLMTRGQISPDFSCCGNITRLVAVRLTGQEVMPPREIHQGII